MTVSLSSFRQVIPLNEQMKANAQRIKHTGMGVTENWGIHFLLIYDDKILLQYCGIKNSKEC